MKHCLLVFALLAQCAFSQSQSGSPVDHLPPNIRQLTTWGERPEFRHDGKRILFLSKVFGDVYEYEIETRHARITLNIMDSPGPSISAMATSC
jgi:hypothetical protein